MEKKNEHAWETLFSVVMVWRRGGTAEDASKSGAAQWRRIRAHLRRGSELNTEHYAYPYVLPYLPEGCSQQTKITGLRLAALVAEFDAIPEFKPTEKQRYLSLGQWCNRVSRGMAQKADQGGDLDPTNPDSIASRLMYLHTLDVEDAIVAVRRIMALASSKGDIPPLDFRSLFYTFFYWGNGLSTGSMRHRRRVLEDYYSGISVKSQGDADDRATE